MVRVADLGQGFHAHVSVADGPLVVLLEQNGANHARQPRAFLAQPGLQLGDKRRACAQRSASVSRCGNLFGS